MSLKKQAAHSLKWTMIDRVLQQLLYAVTGVVLARELSQEDFGLVGAVLVFQAFASLLVDGGFLQALIQRKAPTQTDYSTVLWFNLGVATLMYAVLFVCAPLLARCFGDDAQIIPLSRVLFLSLIINASGIVQTGRLVKEMNMRPVTVANAIGLSAGAVAGILLALGGYGAWAIVWQTLIYAAVKSGMLWLGSRWRPSREFSLTALRSFVGVGSRMMLTSFLNTVFQQIYSLVIGAGVGLRSLGYYTQADKWSKMGIVSISQSLTSALLPALSAVQDDQARFNEVSRKTSRFAAYVTFPALMWLMLMAAPIFHLLFGTKWDASIILFQLLLLRGIFFVFTNLYTNYLLAIGRARCIMWLEVLRDSVAIGTLVATLPWMGLTTPTDPVWGITLLLWGQVAASVIAFVATLWYTVRYTGSTLRAYMADLAPYALMAGALMLPMWWLGSLVSHPLLTLLIEGTVGLGAYLTINHLLHSVIQKDVLAYVLRKG